MCASKVDNIFYHNDDKVLPIDKDVIEKKSCNAITSICKHLKFQVLIRLLRMRGNTVNT